MNFPLKTLSQIGPFVRGFRKRAGLTQAEMAKRLGITQQSYAAFEGNPATASVDRLYRVLRLLDVELVMVDARSTPGEIDDISAPCDAEPAKRRKSPPVTAAQTARIPAGAQKDAGAQAPAATSATQTGAVAKSVETSRATANTKAPTKSAASRRIASDPEIW